MLRLKIIESQTIQQKMVIEEKELDHLYQDPQLQNKKN